MSEVRARLPFLLAGLLPALVLWPAVHGGFLWDDHDLIVANPLLERLDGAGLRAMFTTAYWSSYQPLGWLVYALIRALFGTAPAAYHAASLAAHALVCAALAAVAAELLRRALPRRGQAATAWAAAGAAALFGLQPLHLSSVAWATELPDQLATLFYLLAILVYIRRPGENRALAAAWLLFLVSGLFRWKGVNLPVALLLLDWYPLRRRAWAEKLPFFGLAAALAAVNAWAKGGHHYELAWQPAAAAKGLLLFLGKSLWPVDVLPLYTLHGAGWGAAAAAAALAALAVWAARRWPAVGVAAGAYLSALLPPLLHAQQGIALAFPHYAYLSCLGWYALGAGALLGAGRRAGLAAAALALFWAWESRRHLPAWLDELAFWERAVRLDPDCRIAYHHLGAILAERGRFDEALFYHEEQLRYNPGDPVAREGAARLRAIGAVARPPGLQAP